MEEPTMTTDMIDRDYIAKKLDISKEVLRKTVEVRPDFPKPALRLSRKTVRWNRSDFELWLQRQAQQEKA
jgi:predicted DNA-binding transcriptional regulator AlpA